MTFLLTLALLVLSGSSARAELGVHAGANFEFGSMGTSTADANESRSMGAFGLQVMPGYRTMGKSLLLGLMIDLRFHSQLSGGTTSDFGGQSFNIGPAAAYELAKLKFLLGWDIRARHSAKTSTSYSGSGLRFLLGYRLMGSLWANLQLLTTKFKTRTAADLDTDISANPVKSTMVGFGLSWSY